MWHDLVFLQGTGSLHNKSFVAVFIQSVSFLLQVLVKNRDYGTKPVHNLKSAHIFLSPLISGCVISQQCLNDFRDLFLVNIRFTVEQINVPCYSMTIICNISL